MAELVLRSTKGASVSFAEVDANFINLNNELGVLRQRVYRPISAVFAIPAAPVNGDLIEVGDSSGIENATTVQGVPSDFVGDATLSVRLQFSAPAGKWAWVDYASKAPDARYERFAAETARTNVAGLPVVRFFGVPTWAKRITISFSGVTVTLGANRYCIQVGTAAGFVTSGYSANTAYAPYGAPAPGCFRMSSPTGFIFPEIGSINGELQLLQVANNLWTGAGTCVGGTYGVCWPAGQVTTADRVTSVRLIAGTSADATSGNPTTPGPAFTGGLINVFYEGR